MRVELPWRARCMMFQYRLRKQVYNDTGETVSMRGRSTVTFCIVTKSVARREGSGRAYYPSTEKGTMHMVADTGCTSHALRRRQLQRDMADGQQPSCVKTCFRDILVTPFFLYALAGLSRVPPRHYSPPLTANADEKNNDDENKVNGSPCRSNREKKGLISVFVEPRRRSHAKKTDSPL